MMKHFVLACVLFFGMSSFATQEDDEYALVYDSEGRMTIHHNTFKVLANGRKQLISTPIDPEDLPEDRELVLETEWEMALRIVKTHQGILGGLCIGVIWLLVKSEIHHDTKSSAEELKHAAEERKHEAFSKLEYKRKTHELYSLEHTARKLAVGGLSSTAIIKCYKSISQGKRCKLVKKIIDNKQKEE